MVADLSTYRDENTDAVLYVKLRRHCVAVSLFYASS